MAFLCGGGAARTIRKWEAERKLREASKNRFHNLEKHHR
jgi:hypothetical protein